MTDSVKLDVGGTIFKTSKSTSTKFDGFFRTMFETPIPVPKDESGAIFIDRDPTHFRLILNFMRDGHVDLRKYSDDVSEIEKEAEYYLLEGLMELCSEILDSPEIKVNVGGKMFLAPFEILKRIPKFGAMKKDMADVPKDDTGAMFIDRDPKHFQLILDFVRGGCVPLPKVRLYLAELQKEAEYYLLNGLVEICKKQRRKLNLY